MKESVEGVIATRLTLDAAFGRKTMMLWSLAHTARSRRSRTAADRRSDCSRRPPLVERATHLSLHHICTTLLT